MLQNIAFLFCTLPVSGTKTIAVPGNDRKKPTFVVLFGNRSRCMFV